MTIVCGRIMIFDKLIVDSFYVIRKKNEKKKCKKIVRKKEILLLAKKLEIKIRSAN